MKFSGKAVQQLFFKPSPIQDGAWVRNKCHQTKQSLRGCTNLVSHTKSCFGDDFEDQIADHLKSNGVQLSVDAQGHVKPPKDLKQNAISSFCSSNEKEKRACQWIRWMSARNMPLSEITNKITKEFSKHRGFSRDTIRKCIIATAAEAATNISEELKKAGAITLLFDRWTCDGTSTHYVAIFAGCICPTAGECKEVFLACQPALEVDDLGADTRIELLESALDYYGLLKDYVVCLIGDNCSTNKAISKRWNIPLIGCFNHKLNLAVEKWIEEQRGLQEALDAIANLVSKAPNLKAAARLRDLTMDAHGVCLKAKKRSKTRWASTFDTRRRCIRIRPQPQEIEDLEAHMLSPRQRAVVKKVMPHFEVFRSLTVELQAKGMDLLRCRTQFDSLLLHKECSCMKEHLGPKAEIIESPHFESGVIKIQQGVPLNSDEAEACAKLLKQQPATDDVEEEEPEEELTVMHLPTRSHQVRQ